MNDFSLHSSPGDYVSDFGLSGIHLEFPYIHIKCTPKILKSSRIYQIGQSQQIMSWRKCTATLPVQSQGTLTRGGCEPLNSAGASYIKSHPKNLEKITLIFGAKLNPHPAGTLSCYNPGYQPANEKGIENSSLFK